MSLASQTVLTKVSDHARTLGLFRSINTHEPKDAPEGPHCAFYVNAIKPYPQASGLDRTTAVVVIMGRIYLNMLSEPQDSIDPDIVAATDKLIGEYHTDNTLGATAMTVDLLGATGFSLEARAGYITVGGTKYRSMDIQVPVIMRDAWTQGA